MPYAKPKKHHWGPNIGRVACGRSTKAPRVKTREAWDALDKSQRCALCDDHVQRDGKHRPNDARMAPVWERKRLPMATIGEELGLPRDVVRDILGSVRVPS
jgi:hypothetical protein